MSESKAEFASSKLSMAWTWANIGYDALLAVVLVALTSYVAFDTTDEVLRVGAIIMYGLAGIAATRAIWRLRYRYILASVYVVEPGGIRLQHVPGEPLVTWDQISDADYAPAVPAYRLLTTTQPQPIVLFVERSWKPSGVVNRRNQLAAERIRNGLGRRLRTRWLPW